MKVFILVILFFCAHLADLQAKTYNVHSDAEINGITNKLAPGDEVIITKGNYSDWSVSIDARGTAAKPIIIRGENRFATIFSGPVKRCLFKITGQYIIVKDLTFKTNILSRLANKAGTLIELSNSYNCAVKDCSFVGNEAKSQFLPLLVVSGEGKYNGIKNCLFAGNLNTIDLQVKISAAETPLFTNINRNIFRDKPKVSWLNGNGGECIQIGQDPILLGKKSAFSLVQNNRFIKCNAENEVISNKSSGNKYIGNYFENNDGELVMRGGHDCVISRNKFNGGTGGIRINGTGHLIANNRITGIKTAIRLMYGMAKGKIDTGFYIAASDCIIKDNFIKKATIGILIGDSKNIDWTGKFDTVRYPSRVIQDVAPFDIKLLKNRFFSVEHAEVQR